MKKAFIIILIIGAALLIVGGIVFTATMAKNNWDFSILSNAVAEQKNYSVNSDGIQKIALEASTQDVTFVTADVETVSVDYFTVTSKKGKLISDFTFTVSDGVLTIKEENYPASFAPGFNTYNDDIVIKVPASKEFAIDFKLSTGDVSFGEKDKEIKLPSLKIETDTGNSNVHANIICAGDINVKATTGNITFEGTAVSENADMTCSTGKVNTKGKFFAKKINIKTGTGKVTCDNIDADELNVECSTGDVTLKMSGVRNDYSFTGTASTGDVNPTSFVAGAKMIKVKTSTGDITVTFAE